MGSLRERFSDDATEVMRSFASSLRSVVLNACLHCASILHQPPPLAATACLTAQSRDRI